jgi:NhaP-type Na+/H+ or K+/H+ antiporter
MIADFLTVKQLSDMFCEDGVSETAARAVVLHEIGRNKEKRKKPRKKSVTKTRINQLLQIISFLSNMFYEDGVLEAAACAVVLHEIDRNKEKRKKPRKKRVTKTRINQFLQIISFFTPSSKSLEDLSYSALNLSTHCTIKISFIFSTFSIMFLN